MTDSKLVLIDLNALRWLQDFADWCERKWSTGVDKRSLLYETISTAYFETFAALAKSGQDETLIEIEERERLSLLWRQAAQAVRENDQTAYLIFFEKSKYWLDPGQWDEAAIAGANIDLQSIEKRIKRIGER